MNRSWRGRSRRATISRQSRGLSRKILDGLLAIAILGLLIVLSARLDRAETRFATGSAVVNDGDTITLGTERVRLRGIDAPEYAQICQMQGADYACGRRSREALVRLIGNRPVSCQGRRRDRYDRLLGDCSAGGVNLNGAQVEAGWAVAYGGFEAEQAAARKRAAGLWAGAFDEPRDWRSAHGGMVESDDGHRGSFLDWFGKFFRI